jgi:predicted 3-demethylubiquinone-9 3-methyltransferase (glyoxalase superfamily)
MTATRETTTAVGSKEKQMQAVRPCLVFNDRAEEAIKFYVSVVKNSRVLSMERSDGKGPIPEGQVLHATFELDGREYAGFDGGPHFTFTDAFSLVVTCETQKEIDELWTRLSEGGEEGPCGWLKDRFGLSWQVVPTVLGEMLTDSASGDSDKVMEAMLQMKKLDIAALKSAYGSGC